jgi:hypothetical protein
MQSGNHSPPSRWQALPGRRIPFTPGDQFLAHLLFQTRGQIPQAPIRNLSRLHRLLIRSNEFAHQGTCLTQHARGRAIYSRVIAKCFGWRRSRHHTESPIEVVHYRSEDRPIALRRNSLQCVEVVCQPSDLRDARTCLLAGLPGDLLTPVRSCVHLLENLN